MYGKAMSVEPAELQSSEVDTPSVFTGLIQTNRLAAQHVTHINEAALPFDRAGIAHAQDDKGARVFNVRHSRRVCAVRGLVELRWRALAQRLMRALIVVLRPEVLEGMLLSSKACPRRQCALAFERAVQPLVAAVLLRAAWLNALGSNPQAQPPDRQLRQPAQCPRSKWRSVVGANCQRQPVLAKGVLEPGPNRCGAGLQQPTAEQQIAAEAIADRKRIAVAPVAGPEVSFEIGAPKIIRFCRLHKWPGVCRHARVPSSWLDPSGARGHLQHPVPARTHPPLI